MLKPVFLIVAVALFVSVKTDDFKCYPNQTIHFSNPNSAVYTHYKAFYDDGGVSNCTATTYNSFADIHFDCDSTTVTVTAYFSSRPLSNDNILGGKSITYKFSCNAVSPYNETLTDDIDVSVNETTESATPDYDITAAFYDGDGNEVTEAAVGDTVYFTLKAPAEFSLLPTSCTATGDNSESAALSTNGCTDDSSLIGHFTPSTSGLLKEYEAEFYVFKFYNSDSVTVSCLVKVCPGTGNCALDSCSRRRRRRDMAEEKIEAEGDAFSTVGRRLRIIDRALGGSTNVCGSFVKTMVLSLLLLVTRY